MKKTLSIFLALAIIFSGCYVFFEPQLMGAATAYDEITVSQEVTGEIELSSPADLTMSPAIPGLTGGVGVGTTTWNATTTNSTGYNLSLTASTSPALQYSGNSFADYDTGTADATTSPTYTWSVGASAAEFGYTVEGHSNIAAFFKDTGAICNAGSGTTAYTCWNNASTTGVQIVNRATAATTYESTNVGFRAQVTSGRNLPSGTYSGKIGITATTNP